MIYLIFCILSSTGIFLVFKYLDQKHLPSFPVIIINYFVASFLGFMISPESLEFGSYLNSSWIPISVIIGIVFILMFFVIAKSSKEAGISITTVASKMSVVFPITYSIFIDQSDQVSFLKVIAIISALAGVFLTIRQKDKSNSKGKSSFYIPLLLFVGMGIVDSLVKHAQHFHVGESEAAIFSAVLFLIAFLTGLVILPFVKGGFASFKNYRIWIWGLTLGIVNFGSIFFMVSALNYTGKNGIGIDSSVIFGTNNIGIVSISVLAGLVIFSEKLTKINWIGIGISMLAIFLFSMA